MLWYWISLVLAQTDLMLNFYPCPECGHCNGRPPDSLTLQLPLPSDMFAIVLSGCKLDDGGIIA